MFGHASRNGGKGAYAGRLVLAASALAVGAMPVLTSAALAQSQTTTTTTTTTSRSVTTYGGPVDYNAPPPGYATSAPPAGYATNPPPEPGAPVGYDPSQPPPPPPGYRPYGEANSAADQNYAAQAQYWAQQNCVKAHGDTTAGAVIGGVIGAILGSSLAGRHEGGAGMIVGGALGAGAGAVVAKGTNSNATSPGCPPGYVVREGGYAYTYAPPAGYYYAAPGWYQPWVFVGGSWVYRPYPYHDWYWHTYRGGWGREGWRGGRGGWQGHGDYHGRR